MKTSIIICPHDQSLVWRNITIACLGNIERYTDREDYELIVIDQNPIARLSSEYERTPNAAFHFNIIDKYEAVEDIGYSAANNIGAKYATGDYLCFMHNDVFVWDKWLPKLRSYLEEDIGDIISPHQRLLGREQIKRWLGMSHQEISGERGLYDAGMNLMRRKDYDKTPGWDEDFKIRFPETVFITKICQDRHGLRIISTPEVIITHICGLITKGRDEHNRIEGEEAALMYKKKYQ